VSINHILLRLPPQLLSYNGKKHSPPTFSMEHLLQGFNGVDAPDSFNKSMQLILSVIVGVVTKIASLSVRQNLLQKVQH
jgi:hypothetical protein